MAISLHISENDVLERPQASGVLTLSQTCRGETTMQVAPMVPCYIDMFYPHIGIATLELLEKLSVDVVGLDHWSDASKIDVCIVRSPLGVAETGSILLSDLELQVNTI